VFFIITDVKRELGSNMKKTELKKFLQQLAIGLFIIILSLYFFDLIDPYQESVYFWSVVAFIVRIIALAIIVRALINFYVNLLPEKS
jgi:uncharacterized membrane protein YjfL (UPF0719 family)